MYDKKVILNIRDNYTANAFQIGAEHYVGAGSETLPLVYLYDLYSGDESRVTGCPGGTMSFIPVPGRPGLFVSIQGLFPPFIGKEAGLFLHERNGDEWKTSKVLDVPFSHRCETLTLDGKHCLFIATISRHKEEPGDWSQPGELHLVELDDVSPGKWESRIVADSISRNHGMSRAVIGGIETICISGSEGIFYLEHSGNDWEIKILFDREVSEMSLIDLDGDGNNELVTIEPFHGDTLNIYKHNGNRWTRKFSDALSFGHGLSTGMCNGRPLIVAGNRSGSLALVSYDVESLSAGKVNVSVIEEGVGPTQTQVFSAGSRDYILSSNQKKNEVALYCR